MTTRSLLIAAILLAARCPPPFPRRPTRRPGAAPAQARWELLVPSGTVVPTGAQRDAIKRGNLTAVQLSYVVRPALAVTATLGWARSRDIAAAERPEARRVHVRRRRRAPRAASGGAGEAVTFMPFAGVGAGARSYNYRSLDVDATHNLAAYGASAASSASAAFACASRRATT